LEVLRVGGASLDALAKDFSLSRDSIHRHFKNHVSQKRRAELMAGPVAINDLTTAATAESRSVLDYLALTRSVLFSRFLACAEAGDSAGTAHVAGRLLEALRELGRITGELRSAAGMISITNNNLTLVSSPQFARLSRGLLDLARRFPNARSDVVALLRALDDAPEASGPNGATYHPMIEGEMAEAVHG
jgi:hypothetical protein